MKLCAKKTKKIKFLSYQQTKNFKGENDAQNK